MSEAAEAQPVAAEEKPVKRVLQTVGFDGKHRDPDNLLPSSSLMGTLQRDSQTRTKRGTASNPT
ncbi:hypothetical protein FRC14_004620 [Serendipita sp. 396]|nr:hypothetical protein FRC14_004620 [Serendipita sp. 396]